MTVLLRKLFWFVMFLVSTFCFYVLFEHGTVNFPKSAQKEFENVKTLYETNFNKKEAPAVPNQP